MDTIYKPRSDVVFIDDLNITADGNFIANGDGIITQGNAAVAANVMASNSVNYIG